MKEQLHTTSWGLVQKAVWNVYKVITSDEDNLMIPGGGSLHVDNGAEMW